MCGPIRRGRKKRNQTAKMRIFHCCFFFSFCNEEMRSHVSCAKSNIDQNTVSHHITSHHLTTHSVAHKWINWINLILIRHWPTECMIKKNIAQNNAYDLSETISKRMNTTQIHSHATLFASIKYNLLLRCCMLMNCYRFLLYTHFLRKKPFKVNAESLNYFFRRIRVWFFFSGGGAQSGQ